jgi:hypothetical protein
MADTETDAEFSTANQFLMSPFRMHENGDIVDIIDDDGANGEGADEILSEGNAFVLEHDPEADHVAEVLPPLPDSVAPSSQMPHTSALTHLFRYRSAFNREDTRHNNYEFLANHLFVWMYMHQPVIRRNIPDDPKYAFIRYMDEVEMSIAILGGDKFVDIRDCKNSESQLLAITHLEYSEFRHKLFRMGVDISACDTRRCRSCNAYFGFLNVPYLQF